MGCSDSKITNIDTINRSKERKTFMKQSITAHKAFSTSHSMYLAALRNMGFAFSDYAKGELQTNCENSPWEFFSMLTESDDKSRKVENLVIPKKVVENDGENVKLLEMFNAVDDCFLKASESAYNVSKILDVNKLDLHSKLADKRGYIDHSTRVMRVITWNYESFGGQKNGNDVKDDFTSKEKETLATLLDEILAWENKFYDQVKAGELMKHEYEKKAVFLDKRTKRGTSNDSLERTKATVGHLHTRYIIEMNSIDSTVIEIKRIRDEQLYPKLVQLVKEMSKMWENMRKQHENQFKIAQSLTSIKISQSRNEINGQSLKCTQQFRLQVQVWCSEFGKLIQHQKVFIKSLNNWLKVNHIAKANNLKPQNRKIELLLRIWQDELEKLSETKVKTALTNLADVFEIIVYKKSNEMKWKEICEKTKRDLAKISQEFEKWCDKKISKRMPSGEMDVDVTDDKEVIVEQERGVTSLKRRLTTEEEEYRRWCDEVDEAVACLYDGLPEVFTTVIEFSSSFVDMYGSMKSRWGWCSNESSSTLGNNASSRLDST